MSMQAKDVPDRPVLEFLAALNGVWANWYFAEGSAPDERNVRRAMPPKTPSKVVLAKMRQLMKRGLVDGCPCGCRGDFVITQKGRDFLALQGLLIKGPVPYCVPENFADVQPARLDGSAH